MESLAAFVTVFGLAGVAFGGMWLSIEGRPRWMHLPRRRRPVEPTYQDPNAFLDLYQWKRARRLEDRVNWECKHRQLLDSLPLSRSELAAHQARKAALKVLEPIAERVTPTVYSFPVKARGTTWWEQEMAAAWGEYQRGLLDMKQLKRRVKEIDHERLMHGQPGHRGW